MSIEYLNWAVHFDIPAHQKIILVLGMYSSGEEPVFHVAEGFWEKCGLSFSDWEVAMHDLIDSRVIEPIDNNNSFRVVELWSAYEKAQAAPANSVKGKDLSYCGLYIAASNEPNTRLYKVGISTNIQRRVKSLKTANPHGVTLVETYNFQKWNCAKIERHAHSLIEPHRVNGEWFDCPLDFILQAVEEACSDPNLINEVAQ